MTSLSPLQISILNVINLDKYNDDPDIILLRNIVSTYKNIPLVTTLDMSKPSRPKTVISPADQCVAKKSSGTQCTRRRKNAELYCGTHLKGCPHGDISTTSNDAAKTRYTVSVWIQIIDEITFYIDDNHNIYNSEDIMNNKVNPKVIAKYDVDENGKYSIRRFIEPNEVA